jgi:diguanylate cyclase (GGDEF)-like protein
MLDLERFRSVNETLGMAVGDALLKKLARRLALALPGSATLARVGANTFAVAAGPLRAGEIGDVLQHRLLASFDEAFDVEGRQLRLAARAGIALYPNDGADAAALYVNAEAALKNAKQSGDRYLFYRQQMNAHVAERLALENRLRVALGEEQFTLYYQPRVDLASGRISGFEGLLRWRCPQQGLVAPAAFIPLMEETGLILQAGRWAIARASADYAAWSAKGYAPPRIAVNVSALQLRQDGFVEQVLTAAAAGGPYADRLDIEITESMMMTDLDGNIGKLAALQAAGMQVAMDDFGTGYSSLSYLAKLPVNSLKIDRSFVRVMLQSPEHRAIVSTVVSLGHALGMKVVAEGVETEEQRALLLQLRCDEMQGYLFSPPLAPEAMESYLEPAVTE